jgi:Fic-DOC domain mobile mystery protein B
VTDLLADANGATPLEPEELEALIPSHITLRAELNEAEQAGILAADEWAFRRRRDVLNERFLKNLHRRMLGKVWRWAGEFRHTERNIGVQAYRIAMELRHLLDDVRYLDRARNLLSG